MGPLVLSRGSYPFPLFTLISNSHALPSFAAQA